LPVIAYASVPASAGNGEYRIRTLIDAAPASQANLATTVGIEQIIEVSVSGQQVMDLKAKDVYIRDVEAGQTVRLEGAFANDGNVDVAPFARVTFSRGALKVASGENTSEMIPAQRGANATLVEWDSRGQQTGDYVAQYTISVQGQEIRTGTVYFKLLPLGSLTRAGKIESVTMDSKSLRAGAMTRADVAFRNSGESDARARFLGQVYREGALVGQANSEAELLVRPGTVSTLSVFVPLAENGHYQLRGRVNYEGAQTDELVQDFTVGSPAPGASASGSSTSVAGTIGGAAVFVVLLAGTAATLARRRLHSGQRGA
jgi:hypothetical protein